MGVPSTRTPVRIARGTYANLTTTEALASLQEGEICFTTDENKLYVKEGASLTSVSATKNAAPTPSDVTATPAFTGGTGTQADPYLITNGAVAFSGGTLQSSQEITISATAGDFVVFTDNSPSGSGDRFGGQDVGIVNSAGKFTFKLKYDDDPATGTDNTTYTGNIQIGTVHFAWVVVQSNLTALSEQTATTISGSLSSGSVQTAVVGSATGGTSPYTYATRWQRSFNGTDGWFDINGATGTTYTIDQPDAGYYVRAVSTATDSTQASQGGPLTLELPSASSGQINLNTAPVIDTVSLTTTSGANRFTSKDFNSTVVMNTEGVPTSTKSMKVTLSGGFTEYPETDDVSTVNVSDPVDQAPSQFYISEWGFTGKHTRRIAFNENGNEWIYCPDSVSNDTYYTTDGTPNGTRSQTNSQTYTWSDRNYGTYFNYGAANQFFWLGYKSGTGPAIYKGLSINNITNQNQQFQWGWTVTGNDWTFAFPDSTVNSSIRGFNKSLDSIISSDTSIVTENEFHSSGTVNDIRWKHAWFQGTKFFFVVYLNSNKYHYLKYWDTADYTDNASIAGQVVTVLDFNSLGYTWGGAVDSDEYRYHFAIDESSFCAGDATKVWIGDADGQRWLQLSGTNFSTVTLRYADTGKQAVEYRTSIWYKNSRLYHFTHDAGNVYNIRVMTSDNDGQSWTTRLTQNGSSSPETDGSMYWRAAHSQVVANGKILGNTYYTTNIGYNEYVDDKSMDVIVASGKNLSNNEVRVGDTLRQGSVNGVVSSINTGTNTLTFGSFGQQFTTNSPLINTISHSGINTVTLYGVLNSSGNGQITDLVTTDPGFVDYGPGLTDTISFPAILPSSYTPDQELPAGTSIKISIRATNSSGTDTEESPSITPS